VVEAIFWCVSSSVAMQTDVVPSTTKEVLPITVPESTGVQKLIRYRECISIFLSADAAERIQQIAEKEDIKRDAEE
jgi:hypothetical protein